MGKKRVVAPQRVVLKFFCTHAVLSSSVGPEGDMEPKQL